MKKLMAIFAHPDDEGAIAGILAKYAQQGEVMLVCGTRGEVGKISDPTLATQATLGEVRTIELQTACQALGIQHLRFLNYRDSGMVDTPENEDARALVQADPDEAKGKIIRLIRDFQPQVVVTFEPFGWYGHPDHIMVGKWATEAFPLAGDAQTYPELGAAWQPDFLYHAVIPFSTFGAVIEEAIAGGYIEESSFDLDLPEDELRKTEAQVTHIIDVSRQFKTKQTSMQAHRTQFSPDHMFNKIPPELMKKSSGFEHFIQVMPPPGKGLSANPKSDLFE